VIPALHEARTILCLGAHADDIEIGCGGTLLRLLAGHGRRRIVWVVLSADELRAAEARHGAESFLHGAAERDVRVEAFRDSYFPYHDGAALKEYFHRLAKDVEPDVIFTHALDDRHQDHRLVGELTWNAFRGPLILEYEIPKFDGDLGRPNVLVRLDRATCERKVQAIVETFASQRDKPWFDVETFWALLRLRGVEAGHEAGFAEAFHGRKVIL
jgi:LmbE family N-acetylglucosaminyl deacetylase